MDFRAQRTPDFCLGSSGANGPQAPTPPTSARRDHLAFVSTASMLSTATAKPKAWVCTHKSEANRGNGDPQAKLRQLLAANA
jgi:hypothetical protein